MAIEQQKAEAYAREKLHIAEISFQVDGTKNYNELALQHWLKVLEQVSQLCLEFNHFKGTELKVREEYSELPWIAFNLTTGQPASEADYNALNEIFGI